MTESGIDVQLMPIFERDVMMAAEIQNGRIDQEWQRYFLTSIVQTIAVLLSDLPLAPTTKTVIDQTPVGERPEPVILEFARRGLKGEGTGDIPRVNTSQVPADVSTLRIPRVRIHLFIPAHPKLLLDQKNLDHAAQLAQMASTLTPRDIEMALPALQIDKLDPSVQVIKSDVHGSDLIPIAGQTAAESFIQVCYRPLNKTPGLIETDTELVLLNYMAQVRETKEAEPGTVDIFCLADFNTSSQFTYSPRPGRENPHTTYWGEILGQTYTLISFYSQDDRELIFDELGTRYSKDIITQRVNRLSQTHESQS